jgi:hypothetical protein
VTYFECVFVVPVGVRALAVGAVARAQADADVEAHGDVPRANAAATPLDYHIVSKVYGGYR